MSEPVEDLWASLRPEADDEETGTWIAGFRTEAGRRTLHLELDHYFYGGQRERSVIRCSEPFRWEITEAPITDIAVATEHPLLAPLEPRLSLSIYGRPEALEEVVTQIEADFSRVATDLLTLNGVLAKVLEQGYGVVATGVATYIRQLAHRLEGAGATTAVQPDPASPDAVYAPADVPWMRRAAPTAARLKILLLGAAGLVIASAFEPEP